MALRASPDDTSSQFLASNRQRNNGQPHHFSFGRQRGTTRHALGPLLIADDYVSHSREANGKGVWTGVNYLFTLGPQALPAIDRAIALRSFDPALVSRRGCLVEQQVKQMASWRSWGLRSWRLQRALDAQPKSISAG